GDVIVIDKFEGAVEHIGIRSTRIRLYNGRLVTLPNAQFTDKAIENITIEPARRVNVILGLTSDTPLEKVDLAIDILKQIVVDIPNVSSENKFVFFEKLNTYSLDVRLIYHIEKAGDLLEVQSSVNREILKRFTEAKIEFAFPTQTIYNKN
ncbi:MAG TPA: mechanosensitive ion channel domain-containing protein, partial [Chitinophagales bacterium]